MLWVDVGVYLYLYMCMHVDTRFHFVCTFEYVRMYIVHSSVVHVLCTNTAVDPSGI